MLLHHLDVLKCVAVSLVLCLKLTLLIFMQFASFLSFNFWMCSCAEASLSLFNSCFWNCLPHISQLEQRKKVLQLQSCKRKYIFFFYSKPVQDHSQRTAAGGLLLVSLLPPILRLAASLNSVEACWELVRQRLEALLLMCGWGAKSDSKGVKGDTPGEPMMSSLRWFMFKLEDRTLEFHPSPPPWCVTECICTSGSV